MTIKPEHFEVQLSEPYKYASNTMGPSVNGQPTSVPYMRTSRRNVTLDVITTSAYRAIELAMERHPEGEIHVCQRRGVTHLIFDPLVVEHIVESGYASN